MTAAPIACVRLIIPVNATAHAAQRQASTDLILKARHREEAHAVLGIHPPHALDVDRVVEAWRAREGHTLRSGPCSCYVGSEERHGSSRFFVAVE
jgi:hypothetical protein